MSIEKQQQQQRIQIEFTKQRDIKILRFVEQLQNIIRNEDMHFSYTKYGFLCGALNGTSNGDKIIENRPLNAIIIDMLELCFTRGMYCIERALCLLHTCADFTLRSLTMDSIINNQSLTILFVELCTSIFITNNQDSGLKWPSVSKMNEHELQRENVLKTMSYQMKYLKEENIELPILKIVIEMDSFDYISATKDFPLLNVFKYDFIHPVHRFFRLLDDSMYTKKGMMKIKPIEITKPSDLYSTIKRSPTLIDLQSGKDESQQDDGVVLVGNMTIEDKMKEQHENKKLIRPLVYSVYEIPHDINPIALYQYITNEQSHALQFCLISIMELNISLQTKYRLPVNVTIVDSKSAFQWILQSHSRMLTFINMIATRYYVSESLSNKSQTRVAVINRLNSEFNLIIIYLGEQMSTYFNASSWIRDMNLLRTHR